MARAIAAAVAAWCFSAGKPSGKNHPSFSAVLRSEIDRGGR